MKLNMGLLFNLANNGIVSDEWYNLVLIGFVFISVVAAYLLGSINSAIIVSRIFYGEDVRTKGSGNAGLTNMIRNYGKKAALLTLFGDVFKAVIAILFTSFLLGFDYKIGAGLNSYCYLTGVFVAIGHVFPIYYKFKGGKGVLVTATTAFVLTPLPALILFVIFATIFAISKYVSLGSITVAALYPVLVCLYVKFVCSVQHLSPLLIVSVILLGLFIIWCHRENIKRLINGTENKLSFNKKS